MNVSRHYKGTLGEQIVADLPLERPIPNLPAFTNTGVDSYYFGPTEIKRGHNMIVVSY